MGADLEIDRVFDARGGSPEWLRRKFDRHFVAPWTNPTLPPPERQFRAHLLASAEKAPEVDQIVNVEAEAPLQP